MDKQKIYEIIKIVCTAIISIAATLLSTQSCISTKNYVTNSDHVRIESQQSAQQKNDSINFKVDVKK